MDGLHPVLAGIKMDWNNLIEIILNAYETETVAGTCGLNNLIKNTYFLAVH